MTKLQLVNGLGVYLCRVTSGLCPTGEIRLGDFENNDFANDKAYNALYICLTSIQISQRLNTLLGTTIS